MKIPMTDLCERCKSKSKFNDVVFHDDIISAEYICDCGNIHRNLLHKVEFINNVIGNKCNTCKSNIFGYCYRKCKNIKDNDYDICDFYNRN